MQSRAMSLVAASLVVLMGCGGGIKAEDDATGDVGDVQEDFASDAAPDTSPDVPPDTEPDTTPDTTPDATPDTEPDTSLDTTPDTEPDTVADTSPDTPEDTAADTTSDTVIDTPVDTAVDTPVDTTVDTAVDTLVDTVVDTIVDTSVDTSVDTAVDTAVDTPIDTSIDTAVDDVGTEEIVVGVCGDGVPDPGEACDDGDTVTEACDTTDPAACMSDCSMLLGACGDGGLDAGETCDDGDADSMDACTTSCTANDHNVGAPCTCTGSGCSALDFTAGTIVGCDTAAADENSTRTLACVRSVNDTTYGVQVYMAEGYCTLMAIGCSGTFCFLVPTTGNVSTFSCPAGYAVTTEVRTQMGMTITTKSCLVTCTSDSECRWNAAEAAGSPWAGTCGQYACIPEGDGGAYVCADPRNYL